MPPDEFEVNFFIGVRKKYLKSPITPLDDMMRATGNDDARDFWHRITI